MSPHKRLLIPILVYCEGLHDQVFTRHLLQVYRIANSPHYFDIKRGDGGSPKSLTEKALKMPGQYQERIIIFDNDRGPADLAAAKKAAKGKQVTLSYFDPSLEFILLRILEPRKDHSGKSTEDLKKYFHDNHIQHRDRGNIDSYKIFTKEILEAAREQIPGLHEKIIYLER